MKIDYEITVGVNKLTQEEKKRVQDAFFKLGLSWWDGDKYVNLDKGCYTNKMTSGLVTQNLMWSAASMKPTHTIKQLFKLAGMENEVKLKTNLKPFDLEKALAGDPIITRDGREVTQATLFNCDSLYPLRAVVGGDVRAFTKDGVNNMLGISPDDLFMKQKTHTVNGFEVPKPATEQPEKGSLYYVPNVFVSHWFSSSTWDGDDNDLMGLVRNIVFLNKEDAIANAKAMAGINPYEE